MRVLSQKHIVRSIAIASVGWPMFCIVASAYAQNSTVLDNKQFNEWVFNGNRGEIDEISELMLAIRVIDRACHLSRAQKEKLCLAGHDDYVRFMQHVEELRVQFVGNAYDSNNLGKLSDTFEPLAEQYDAGLLDESSQFAKIFHRILTPKQHDEYKAFQTECSNAPHTTMIGSFVSIFEVKCPLKPEQRDGFFDLLLKETPLSKQISEQEWNGMLAQANKIPDAKLQVILDESQLAQFRRATEQVPSSVLHFKRELILPDF